MDLADPRTFSLFLEIYGTLPRAGPGSTADTLRALDLVPDNKPATILDLGCGPGAQTLVLAEALPKATILALDLTPEMVTEARRRCAEAGVDDRVEVSRGDLLEPGVPSSSLDLVWCEGAIYFAGVENALTIWKPLLKPNGVVAFTEPISIDPVPPEALVAWWREEYPAITDEAGVRDAVTAAGYDTIGSFTLPAPSWWNEYYGPMEQRVTEFRARHRGDDTADGIADEAEKEIATFRRYHRFYSYGFFIVKPVEEDPTTKDPLR